MVLRARCLNNAYSRARGHTCCVTGLQKQLTPKDKRLRLSIAVVLLASILIAMSGRIIYLQVQCVLLLTLRMLTLE